MNKAIAAASCIGCLLMLGCGAIFAQDYPRKPIRLVTADAGGGTDLMSRLIAQAVTGPLGQPMIVDNRRSGFMPGEIVARAAADGYTVIFYSNILWVGTLLAKAPYDVQRDFTPISLAGRSPNIVVVHPSLPVRNIKELVALARSSPSKLDYASTGSGGSAHLATELFKSMAGVDLVRISYKGSGAALNALVGGEVRVMFASAGSVVPFIKSGRLRALAVTGLQPSELFPGLPPVAASGLSGYDSTSMYGMLAPARMAPLIVARLNREVVAALRRGDVREQFMNGGIEPVGSTPAEFGAAIRNDMTQLSKVIRDAGIRAD